MPDITLTYAVAGPTLAAFHQSPAFVRGVVGPIGSGKSTACVMELLRRAAMQAPGPDGVRRTRYAIIRNTYGELLTTTIKTWQQWAPMELGKFTAGGPIVHHIRQGDVDCEVLFLALDRDEDHRKLLSQELTGAWLNEARELPRGILDTVTGRVGRFPPMRDGGCTWSGVLLDTNAPDSESWWFRASQVERPEGWAFYRQPSGRSAQAENLANLPAGYYERVMAGKNEDWVRVYVDAEFAFVQEGKPVYPMFRDSVHVAKEPIEPLRGLPLLLGVDFGLTPAAIIGQRLADGRWLIVDEVVTEDCGVMRFAELLASYIARQYPGFKCEGWADPAGNARGQNDERTALDIMREYTAWRWHPAPDNAITMRLESVKGTLNRMVDGMPGFQLSPTCAVLRKGFAGGYHYRLVRSGNGALFDEKPNKDSFSHPHDALQYLLSGGGEASVVMRKERRASSAFPRTAIVTNDRDIFG